MSKATEDRVTEAEKADGHGAGTAAGVPSQHPGKPVEEQHPGAPVEDRPAAHPGDGDEPPPISRRPRRTWTALALGLLIVGVFAGAAAGYSLLQPTVYGAQAELILTPRPELSDASVDRAMVTQSMVVKSDPVLAPVAARVGMPLPRLRDEVSAEIVGRSNILRLTVGDRDQARAVTLVQLITAEYLRAPTGSPTPVRGTETQAPPVVSTLLSAASPLEALLQPQPVRAFAAGVILGLLVAAGVVTLLLRPRILAPLSPRRR